MRWKKMKYFVDWSRTKQVALVYGEKEKQTTPKEFVNMFEENDEVYLESGFSSRIIYSLLDRGIKVYRANSASINDFRTDLGFGDKGSDLDDAHLIQAAYEAKPDLFIEMEKPDESDRELRKLYTMYRQITRDITRFKNIISSHNWEYGTEKGYNGAVEVLEVTKKDILKQMIPYIKEDLSSFKEETGIKGIGPALMAQLLAVAHPKNFSSLSKYLAYVGCKASTFYKTFENGKGSGRGRFNRDASQTGYLMVSGVMRAKDPITEEWYYVIKEKFQKEHPDWSNGICHGKASNRLRTQIMKRIYKSLSNNDYQEILEA